VICPRFPPGGHHVLAVANPVADTTVMRIPFAIAHAIFDSASTYAQALTHAAEIRCRFGPESGRLFARPQSFERCSPIAISALDSLQTQLRCVRVQPSGCEPLQRRGIRRSPPQLSRRRREVRCAAGGGACTWQGCRQHGCTAANTRCYACRCGSSLALSRRRVLMSGMAVSLRRTSFCEDRG